MEIKKEDNGFRFLSLDRLKAIETDLAGIRVDKPARDITDPSALIADAINEDIKSLKTIGGEFEEAGLSVCANVAIKAKQSFGFFPDDVIDALASNQSNLNIKAKALSVLDEPKEYSHLVDDIFEDLDLNNDAACLSSLSQLTATLMAIDSRDDDSFFQEDKDEAAKKIVDLSFEKSEPFYLCNLAIECDSDFLKPASELCFREEDSLNSMRLLTEANGWAEYADKEESASFVEKLSYTSVGGLSLDGLKVMASRCNDGIINSVILNSLIEQSKSIGMDNRLAAYLEGFEAPIEKDLVENIHASLVKEGHKMNTINAQKSLFNLIKTHPHNTEPYDDWMLEKTIEEAERHYGELKAFSKNLTLADITEATLYVKDENDNVSNINLFGMSNEQSMRDALSATISGLGDSYEVDVGFRDATTPLLQNLIKTQIEKSLDGQPNYLDKILTLPVNKVAVELDSRDYIQEKIIFDAISANQDDSAEHHPIIWESLNNDGIPDTPVNRINPILTIKKKDASESRDSSYKLASYNSFDEFLEDIKDDESLDFSHVNVNTQNGFLSESFNDDLERFIKDRTSVTVYNVNKHFTHTVNQFIDSKSMDPDIGSKLKESLSENIDIEIPKEYLEPNRNKAKI